MEIILLERVENLGAIGDVVKVKNGFARNFLFPQHKALLATDANKARFERERAAIEARNEKARAAAQTEGQSLDGTSYVLIRQAGETGQLYGSVAARDIADAINAAGHKIERKHVAIQQPIKTIGDFAVKVRLHDDVSAQIDVRVVPEA